MKFRAAALNELSKEAILPTLKGIPEVIARGILADIFSDDSVATSESEGTVL
jgi:hypothetical protein